MIVAIDGNIGCGKSSILNHLHKFHKIAVDLEPNDNWNELYSDRKDAFRFHVRIWIDRCWIQEKAESNTILIERSPYFIQNAYIISQFHSNMLTFEQYDFLKELHRKTDYLWLGAKYIYLRSSPENCYKKVSKSRYNDRKIDYDDLKCIHDAHEKAYNDAVQMNANIICIDVDTNKIDEIVGQILNFIG